MSSARASKKSDQAFKTISEAAETLGLEQHVLRFWETKFKDISPVKRAGGRRYYRPEDIDALKTVQQLLHVHKMTIKGAQQLLNKRQKQSFAEILDIAGSDEGVESVDVPSSIGGNAVDLHQELSELSSIAIELRAWREKVLSIPE